MVIRRPDGSWHAVTNDGEYSLESDAKDPLGPIRKLISKLKKAASRPERKEKKAVANVTTVEVTEGEVQVIDRATGKIRVLKAGEKLSFIVSLDSGGRPSSIPYTLTQKPGTPTRTTVRVLEGRVEVVNWYTGAMHGLNGGESLIIEPTMEFKKREVVDGFAFEVDIMEKEGKADWKEAVARIAENYKLGDGVVAEVSAMMDKALSGPERAEILRVFQELARVHSAASLVLSGYPGAVDREMNIVIPISNRFSPFVMEAARAKYGQLWKAVRDAIGRRFSGLNVRFYDGTLAGLDEQLAKIDNRSPGNTLAYIDADLTDDAGTFKDGRDRGVTLFRESLPEYNEPAYVALEGHIALGALILDMVENPDRRSDERILDYAANLAVAISEKGKVSAEDIKKALKAWNTAGFKIILPAMKTIDVDKEMEGNLAMQTAMARSL
jgi:hypothetical protein